MTYANDNLDFGSAFAVSPKKFSPPRGFMMAKRCFDIMFALLLVPIALIGMLILIAWNPSQNPGKLLYRQKRVGKNGKIFTIYKFRTMLGDADATKFACAEKDRISAFGHWLRSKRFDELPQIWNVLKGDMSLIGPRPEQVDFAKEYGLAIPNYALRHAVRPGISGLAQVKLGYTSCAKGANTKLQWDMHYIRNLGFKLEAFIFRRTLKVVRSRFGAK